MSYAVFQVMKMLEYNHDKNSNLVCVGKRDDQNIIVPESIKEYSLHNLRNECSLLSKRKLF